MARKNKIDWRNLSWRGAYVQIRNWTVSAINARMTLVSVWAVVVLALGYLTYIQVWQVLTKPLELPAGVVSIQAGVDAQLLEKINQQRLERMQYRVPASGFGDTLR